ncbi:MAG: hypothetical protein WD628_04415 [Thermomicrobiales bacterium]
MLAVPAAAQDDGVVSGTVINETTGEPAAAIEVTISKFADQSGASEDTTTTTADDGSYRFESLDTSDGLAYAVSVRYADVLYGSSMILLSNDPRQESDIAVFETTTDQSVVSVATRGLIVSGVDRETGVFTVTDAYTFNVAGDMTVVEGNDGYSVRFPVPDNVAEITPRPGFNFGTARVEETSVLVTTPLKPGSTTASLDYAFLYTGTAIDVPLSAAYPTEAVQVLVPAGLDDAEIVVSADGTGLVDGGVVAISGRDYHVWSASDIDSGSTFTLQFSGLPRPPATERLHTVEPAIIAALALLAAAGITVWTVVSRGLHRPRPVVLAPAAAAPLDVRRERLSVELRLLEDSWQAAEIDEESYRTGRRAILEDLRSISRQYRGLGDDE